MTLAKAINLGLQARLLVNPGARLGGGISAPALQFQRASTSPLVTTFAQFNPGEKVYFGHFLDMRDHAMWGQYPGGSRGLLTTGPDHGSADSGIYGLSILAGADPRNYANWLLYEDAVAAGHFDGVTGSKPSSNPIYIHNNGDGSGSTQTETPYPVLMPDGSVVWFYQTDSGLGGGQLGQGTWRLRSSTGLDFTGTPELYLRGTVPSDQIGGANDSNNHDGYARHYRVAGVMPNFPYDYFISALTVGSEDGQSSVSGINDPKNGTPVWVKNFGAVRGRAADELPLVNNFGPYGIGASIVHFRMTQAGLAAVVNCSTAVFGTGLSEGRPHEVLWDDINHEPISDPVAVMDLGAPGAFDDQKVILGNIIEEDDYYWCPYLGQSAAGTSGIGIAWAPKAAAPQSYVPISPAIPSGLIETVYDFNVLTALPGDLTELKYGSVLPTSTWTGGANGLEVSVDGAASPNKGNWGLFASSFVPDDTEFLEIFLEGIRTSSASASRHVVVGATQVTDQTWNTAGGFFVGSDPAGSSKMGHRQVRADSKSFTVARESGPGPGVGTQNYAFAKKSLGLRIMPPSGRVIMLGQGKIEVDQLSPTALSLLNPATAMRPFIALRGLSALSTERFDRLTIRRSAAVAGAGRTGALHSPIRGAVVDFNYHHGRFRIGDSDYTSLAAMEADARVSLVPGNLLHMVDISGLLAGGVCSSGTMLFIHQVTRPSSGTSVLGGFDDGADGDQADNFARMPMNTSGNIDMQVTAAGVTNLSTSSLNRKANANGDIVITVGTFGQDFASSSEITGATKADTSGATATNLSRVLIGGRFDLSTGLYGGTIKRAIFVPNLVLTWDACVYYAAMA